jgi:hypothetical protein
MRRAINNVSSRNSVAPEIRSTLRHLYTIFDRIYIPSAGAKYGFSADLKGKIEVMKASLAKVEDACYAVHVRGKEIPEGWKVEFVRDEREGKRGARDEGDEDGGGKRRRVDDD